MAFNSIPSYILEQFPLGDGMWAVRNYGPVIRVANRRSAVRVIANIVRLKARSWDELIEHHENKNPLFYAGSRSQPTTIELSVGLLPMVRIGTVVQHRRSVGLLPAREQMVFNGVDYRLACLVRGDDLQTAFTCPEPEYSHIQWCEPLLSRTLPPSACKAYYLVMPSPPAQASVTDWIVIPSWEVGLSYYFASSRLTNLLFNGGFLPREGREANEIWDVDESVPLDSVGRPTPGGRPHVQLRSRIANSLRWQVARLAYSNPEIFPEHVAAGHQAFSACTRMVRSAEREWINQQSAHVEIVPPYLGLTDVEIEGSILPAGESLRVFWARRILRCWAPFPIADFSYFRDNPGDTDGIDDPMRREAYGKTRRRSKKIREGEGKPKKYKVGPEPPSPGASTQEVIVNDDRFEFLKVVTDNEVRFKPRTSRAGRQRLVNPPEGDKVSVDEDETSGSGSGSLLVTDQSSNPTTEKKQNDSSKERVCLEGSFKNFQLLADYLEEHHAAAFEFLALGSNETVESDCPVAVFPFVEGTTWSYGKRDGGYPDQRPQRRVLVLEVKISGRFAYFLEAERVQESNKFSILALRRPDGAQVSTVILNEVLGACARNRKMIFDLAKEPTLASITTAALAHSYTQFETMSMPLVRYTAGENLLSSKIAQKKDDARVTVEHAPQSEHPKVDNDAHCSLQEALARPALIP